MEILERPLNFHRCLAFEICINIYEPFIGLSVYSIMCQIFKKDILAEDKLSGFVCLIYVSKNDTLFSLFRISLKEYVSINISNGIDCSPFSTFL